MVEKWEKTRSAIVASAESAGPAAAAAVSHIQHSSLLIWALSARPFCDEGVCILARSSVCHFLDKGTG